MKIFTPKWALLLLFIQTAGIHAQDSTFYIYLCFGQSNMEGQGTIESQDQTVDSRFQTFQALTCSNLSRTKEQWYNATPPTCNCWSGLSPADYFGRMMVQQLPDSITVGIINVSIGGCDIRLFDKDIYEDYDSTYTDSWFTDKVAAYNWNPYQYLIDLAQLAQQDGVIKGILLHQGETNTGNSLWPSYVKKIYNDMITDLSLDTADVPLIAGEVLQGSGSCCSSMNTIINRLPDSVATAHVVSSEGCEGADNAHFTSEGYRILGRRYAYKMLQLMGVDFTVGIDDPKIKAGYRLDQNFPNPATHSTTISFEIPRATFVSLELRNSMGVLLKQEINKELNAGQHSIDLDMHDLKPGVYHYSISAEGITLSKRLVVGVE